MIYQKLSFSPGNKLATKAQLAFSFIFLVTGFLSFSQELKFIEKSEGLLLIEEGKPRFFYRTLPEKGNQEFSRANYIHPLYGFNGEVLTEDFPEDHPHHHGIFWAWHQLYANGERIADPWLNQGISWQVVETDTKIQGQNASLTSEVLWIQTSEDKPIIKEDLLISFTRLKDKVIVLTFDITLTALTDGVAIGGSEDAKGYGGFSARFILPKDIRFYSTNGEVEPEVNAVQAGPWMNLTGRFGLPDSPSTGIIIMGEPEKLPSFQGWILRSSESMQNLAFPGKDTLAIAKGESLNFRNQLVIHNGLSNDKIWKIYNDFATD